MLKLKNLVFPAALIALLWLPGCGETTTTETPDVPSEEENKPEIEYGDNNTLLWEISGNGLSAPSYLYGTIHIQDKRVFAYDTIVEIIFDSCDAYAMELLLDEINPVEYATMMIMKDTLLSDLITEEEFAIVQGHVKSKMPLLAVGDKFNKMKPFFTSTLIATSDLAMDMGEALDAYFDKIAKKQEKTRIGIEQFSDQINAINAITLQEQADMLVQGIKDSSETMDNFDDLLSAYLSGNLDDMLELTSDTSMPDNFVYEFLDKRNIHMAERIDEITHEQITFCAIGAGHLGGPKGVIALLIERGFTLKPIKTEFSDAEQQHLKQ